MGIGTLQCVLQETINWRHVRHDRLISLEVILPDCCGGYTIFFYITVHPANFTFFDVSGDGIHTNKTFVK